METREKAIRPTQSTMQLMGNTPAPLEERHRAEHVLEDDYFRKHEQEGPNPTLMSSAAKSPL